MEFLAIILASTFGKIYLAGFGINAIYQCYNFNKMIKVLDSGKSFLFCMIHTLIQVCKGLLWPVILPLMLIQLVFLKGALDDYNEAMAQYNGGYELEDEDKED